MIRFIVCDESEAGKGEAFDRRYTKYLESFDTLKEARKYIKNSIKNVKNIIIEKWDDGTFIEAYSPTK